VGLSPARNLRKAKQISSGAKGLGLSAGWNPFRPGEARPNRADTSPGGRTRPHRLLRRRGFAVPFPVKRRTIVSPSIARRLPA